MLDLTRFGITARRIRSAKVKALKIIGLLFLVNFAKADKFNYCTGCIDFTGGSTVSSSTLPGGSTQYIQNRSTLQSGATFYVSSGTAVQITGSTATLGYATITGLPYGGGVTIAGRIDLIGATYGGVQPNLILQGGSLGGVPYISGSGNVGGYNGSFGFGSHPAGGSGYYTDNYYEQITVGNDVIFSSADANTYPYGYFALGRDYTDGEFFYTNYTGFQSTSTLMSTNANRLWMLPLDDASGFWKSDGALNLSIASLAASDMSALLASTNTWTGGNTYQSTSTFTSTVLVKSSIAIVNSASANSLTVSSVATGVNLFAVSSSPAVSPTDFLLTVSSTSGTLVLGVQNNSHIISSGTTPSMGSCGAAPSGTVIGTDNAGTITIGGGVVTSCVLTFAYPWANTPVCVATDNSVTIPGDISALSTTSVTFSFSASLGGGTLYYLCIGAKG